MAIDKQLHFAAGLLISFLIGCYSSPCWGLYAAMYAGLMKEIRDWGCYRGFDWKDMVVTWMGGFVGYIVMMLPRS